MSFSQLILLKEGTMTGSAMKIRAVISITAIPSSIVFTVAGFIASSPLPVYFSRVACLPITSQ
jgi:hypothetical protein